MSIVANLVGQAYVGDIDQFFRHIEFQASASGSGPAEQVRREESSIEAAPAAPPATSGSATNVAHLAAGGIDRDRPTGLFYRLQTNFTSGPRMEAEARLFLPGNRIARVFPFGGGNSFDVSRCSPDTCGSYQLSASKLAVRWDNGQVDAYTYKTTADGIQLDSELFKFARPVAESDLVGKWVGAGGSGDAFANVYTFGRDGTFAFGAAGSTVGGRFRVQGLALILNFNDGSTKQRTLFAAGSSAPIGLISVDRDIYARR